MTQRSGMWVGNSEHPVQGEMLTIGQTAPDFQLIRSSDMSVKTLVDFGNAVKVISCVPSLDTRVCAIQTKRFHNEMESFGEEVIVLTVSADLPFAQNRWCGAEGVTRTITLSDHKTMAFADAYGVHDTDWRVTQRAAFVLDRDNVLHYVEYMDKIGDEINFEAILNKVRELIG